MPLKKNGNEVVAQGPKATHSEEEKRLSDLEMFVPMALQTSMIFEKARANGERTPNQVAVAALHSLAPRDEVEGMLLTQALGMHNCAMEFMRRALEGGQPLTCFNAYVNSIAKLTRAYSTHMEALQRYRGKGQQKVTVEHVTVNSGGQAFVGAVETQGGGHGKKS